MNRIKLSIAVAALGLAFAAPVSAQNVAANNSVWWGGPAGGPSAFTFLNPLTTVYGRIGFSYSFMQSSAGAGPFPFNVFVFGGRAAPADAWGGDLAIGFRLMPAVRYDLALSGIFNSRTNWTSPLVPIPSIGNARVSSAQLLNNFYLDIAPIAGGLGRFNPYIMAGLGIAWNTVGETVGFGGIPGAPLFVGHTRSSFAWTAGAGLQYQIINHMILDVSYRYLDAGRAQTTFGFVPVAGFNQTSARIQAHQIHVGLVVPIEGLIRGFGN